jgi:transposase
MTIPGIDAIAAISIVAAVGDFSCFTSPDKLVAYVGLNPKVRQSGNFAPVHGRISKAGRAQAGGVLVEAAWSASHASGPLRAFYQRIKARCGFQTAIVATARKMTVLAGHLITKDQDYAFARPALVATSAASSSSPPARPPGAATAASPAPPTTTNNAATPKPPPPSSRKVAAAVPRPYHRR